MRDGGGDDDSPRSKSSPEGSPSDMPGAIRGLCTQQTHWGTLLLSTFYRGGRSHERLPHVKETGGNEC